jgi:hypothetical protein
MKLHQDKTLFRQAVQFTADQMQIPAIYVEKDYWVTFALFTIFSSEIGKDTVFKGGTALSKCYQMIDRFSEDIDLVLLKREGETAAKMKSRLKAVSSAIEAELPEVALKGITRKMGMNRKTAHTYSKQFTGSYGQVRDVIVLESTWLGYHEPYTTKSIVSFVGSMMIRNGQPDIAAANGLLPFELLVLEPVRTICEKIMSLIRFSYSENPVEDLKKKIRHTYDLHQLLQQKEFIEFIDSPAFEEMLLKVANDDVVSFKNNNQWLKHHPGEALLFKHTETVWDELKPVYNGDFKNLVYGSLPDERVILNTLQRIKGRLTDITWTITVNTK